MLQLWYELITKLRASGRARWLGLPVGKVCLGGVGLEGESDCQRQPPSDPP